MPEDRRLASIIYTDIVGYNALMGNDEDKTLKFIHLNHKDQNPFSKISDFP